MSTISPDILAKRIAEADIEMLVMLDKMDQENKKDKRFYIAISTTIASIAGFAIIVSNIYPDIGKILLSAISTAVGVSLTIVSYFQHKKEKRKAISAMLKQYESASEVDKKSAEIYRKHFIDSLVKESKDV